MNIEDLQGHLDHFRINGISHEPGSAGLDKVLRYQDIIGCSTMAELRAWYVGASPDDRRTFLWACIATLAPETTMDIIRYTTISVMRETELNRIYDQAEKDETEFESRKLRFEESKKPIHKHLAQQRRELDRLERENMRLRQELQYARDETMQSQKAAKSNLENAEKYAQIKALLA